ncbi:MAG: Vitamin B12 dependent methionine synthase activation subunit [Oscillospiraceae bacterium]|jgi:5-methyltetrahydrofolate--homocysteine methyltransferase|nr:Vitamin B12 dependent methionine synthase activation subunit [Oscillospiraceae bacterium]
MLEKEVLRYLGCPEQSADSRLKMRIAASLQDLQKACTPRSVWRCFSLEMGTGSVQIGTLEIPGNSLRKHLRGCGQAVLFAATLGAQADFLLERMSRMDIGLAAVYQASAAALVERYCDECEQKIAEKASRKDLFLRPRYSPGYGDFPIECQRGILAVLDCSRRIGLSMTERYMLVPTKSVTAVIGLTRDRSDCTVSKCARCHSPACPFRKEPNDGSAE